MNKFIYLNAHSIPPELCDDLIEYYYDVKDSHYEGRTLGGVNKNIKDTTDFTIPLNAEPGSRWDKINKFLQKELRTNLKMYLDQLKDIPEFSAEQNNGVDYRIFDYQYFTENCFMLQKYEKQKGKYTYHNDFLLDSDSHRVITYLWYINDVEEGGETELWHSLKIKPEKGKLLLFPAHFSVPHCGLMPISSDKIIITGWLYHPNNK
jgi:hypothetical protein